MSPFIILPVYSPPFSPLDVANMMFWYDFSDLSTLWQDTGRTIPVTAHGQPIGGVTNKGLLNFHAAAAIAFPSYNSSGQNGLGTLLFDHVTAASVQQLRTSNATSLPSPLTYFIASTTPAVTGAAEFSYITDQNGCGGNRAIYYANPSSPVRVFNGIELNTTLPNSVFRTVTIEFNTTTQVWNQTSLDTSGNAGTAGQSSHMLGSQCSGASLNNAATVTNIGEVIEYAGAVSASDRLKIQNYLINKWGA